MLISKKITLNAGNPAVELLASEDTAQAYEVFVVSSGPAPVYIGGPDVAPATSAPLPNGPFRVSGESLWVVGPSSGSASTTLSILAYTTE